MSTRAMKLAYKAYAPKAPKATAAANIYIAHGLLGSGQNWTTPSASLAQSPELADKLNSVIALDMRNHGRSPHSLNHTNAALASDLESVVLAHQQSMQGQFAVGKGDLAAVQGKNSILIGHSMGGFAVMGALLRRYNEMGLLPEDPFEAADGYGKQFGTSWDVTRRKKTSQSMRDVNSDFDFAETQPIRDILFNDHNLSKEDLAISSAIAPRQPKVGRIGAAVVVDITPTARLGEQRASADSVQETLDRMTAVNLANIKSYGDATQELLRVGMADKGMRDFVITNLAIDSNGTRPTTWHCNLPVLYNHYGHFQPSILRWFEEASNTTVEGTADKSGLVAPKPCTLPVMFVFGEKSPYNEPEHRKLIGRFFPNATQAVVEGAGHFVHYEKPKDFLKTVTPFIAEHME